MDQISLNNYKDYDSLISKTKEIKAKQETGGVAFSANILSQSLDISISEQANKISKLNTLSTTTMNNNESLIRPDITNQLQKNINNIKFNDHAYGYSVDNNGFMGEDFNKAANLPLDFKMHKSSLDEIAKYNEDAYLGTLGKNIKTFENIDMADTIHQYYKIFSTLMGNKIQSEYTNNDMSALPKGFSYTVNQNINSDGNYLTDVGLYKVTNIYKNTDELQSAYKIRDDISTYSAFNVVKLDLTNNGLNKESHFSPNLSMYKTDDGYTQAGIFIGFLKGIHPRASDSGKTKLTNEAIVNSVYAIAENKKWGIGVNKFPEMDMIKMLQDETAITELLKNKHESLAQKIFDKNQDKELLDRIRILAKTTLI